MKQESINAIAETLSENMTLAELTEATGRLKVDPGMAEKVRYNRPLIPADFLSMIDEGAYSKLFSYQELLYMKDKKGIDMGDYETVSVEGRDKPMWRRK